jgi:ATP-binding cassette subfamily B protein/ATP-binding cassette subfamily C protein LapB
MNDLLLSLHRSLSDLLKLYDIRVDMDGLVRDIPLKSDASMLDHAENILGQIGFVSERVLNPFHFDEPAIVVRAGQGGVSYWSPVQVNSTQDFQEITEALIIRAAPNDNGLDTSIMNTGHALDWFWKPIVQYWPRYSEILVASFFINMLVLATPIYTLNVYDRVVINFTQETLFVLTAGVLIALLFDFLFKTIRGYILERVASDVGAEFDQKLMERVFRIRSGDLRLSVGEQANVFRELQGIREFYAGRLMPTLIDFPFALLFIVIIYLMSPAVAMVPIVTTVLIIGLNFAIHVPMARMTKSYFSSLQSKSSLLIETLAGVPTARMFNAVTGQLFKWGSNVKQTSDVSRANTMLLSFTSNVSTFLSQASYILVVFVGVYQIVDGNLTVGGLIASSILAGRAIGPIVGLSGIIARLRQSQDVLQVIDKFYDLPHDDEGDVKQSPKGPFRGNISVRGVHFQYPGQSKQALHHINLEIGAGQRIGIIGKTAAGKTTLSRILMRGLVPQEGEVLLDGYAYAAIPLTEFRRNVAYVPQDTFFYRGTIRHNILLGRDYISDEALAEAIEVSGLRIVMEHSAQGLDTEVGELGTFLSGGQKQAISIARALVQQPKVIIFDEPTTGMDHMLEAHVRSALSHYLQDKTFIMITHRTTLLPLVDRLILIDSGRVLADGARDDVLQKLGGGGGA